MRRRAAVTDGISGGDKRQRRDQHLVVRLHARQKQRNVERRRAVYHGNRVFGAGVVGELSFEAVDELSD